MELTWCRSFIAVYETGGFTSAAKALHKGQSRISAHVASLEKAVGARLLNRDTQPPTLTTAGELFLPHARAAVAELQNGVSAVAARTGHVTGQLSIGSIPSVSSQVLAPLLSSFVVEQPDVVLQLHEGPIHWLDWALGRYVIELAIRPVVGNGPPEGMRVHRLIRDPWVLVTRDDDDRFGTGSVRLSQLTGVPVLTTGEAGYDPHIGGEFRRVLDEFAIDRRRSMTVTQPTTVVAFVRSGLGVGVIGALAAEMVRGNGVTIHPIEDEVAVRELAVHYPTSRALSPAAKLFLRELVRFVADAPELRSGPW